jgi:integrase
LQPYLSDGHGDQKWTSSVTHGGKNWDTKSGHPRTVPLTQRVGGSAPFTGLRYRDVRKIWDQARDHLGFADDPQWVIHMLRHTCASRLVQGGAQIQYVKEWLGHATISITMRCAHLSPTSLDKLMAILDAQPEEKPRALAVVKENKA